MYGIWKAFLKIQAAGTVQTFNFPMRKVYRYLDLYQILPKILDEVGLGRLKITPRQVKFYFYYQEKWIYIDEWGKYLLNKDNIVIDISDPLPLYRLLDTKDEKVLFETTDKEEIYNRYRQILPYLRRGVLIKRDETIIDVFDHPKYHYNNCVNRMVKNWNY